MKKTKTTKAARWSTGGEVGSPYDLYLLFDRELVGRLWGMGRSGVEAVVAALNAAGVTVPKARER